MKTLWVSRLRDSIKGDNRYHVLSFIAHLLASTNNTPERGKRFREFMSILNVTPIQLHEWMGSEQNFDLRYHLRCLDEDNKHDVLLMTFDIISLKTAELEHDVSANLLQEFVGLDYNETMLHFNDLNNRLEQRSKELQQNNPDRISVNTGSIIVAAILILALLGLISLFN